MDEVVGVHKRRFHFWNCGVYRLFKLYRQQVMYWLTSGDGLYIDVPSVPLSVALNAMELYLFVRSRLFMYSNARSIIVWHSARER